MRMIIRLKRFFLVILFKLKILKWNNPKWCLEPIGFKTSTKSKKKYGKFFDPEKLNSSIFYMVNSWLPRLIKWSNKNEWTDLWIVVKKNDKYYKVAKISISKKDWSLYFFMPYHKSEKWFFCKWILDYKKYWKSFNYNFKNIDKRSKVSIHDSWFSQLSWPWIISWLKWFFSKWYWFHWPSFKDILDGHFTEWNNISLLIKSITDYKEINIDNIKYEHLVFNDKDISLVTFHDNNLEKYYYCFSIWLLPFDYSENDYKRIINYPILIKKNIYRPNKKYNNKISLWIVAEKYNSAKNEDKISWYCMSFANSIETGWSLWEQISMEYYE